jgi:replicative DNA helicase
MKHQNRKDKSAPEAVPLDPNSEAGKAARYLEESVLGAMLLEPRWVLEGINAGLSPAAFTHGERSQVWEVMASQAAKGQAIEAGVVAQALAASGAPGAVGLEVLRGWAAAVEAPGFCKLWLANLLASWRARQAQSIALTLGEKLATPVADFDDLVSRIRPGVTALAEIQTFSRGRDERAMMEELKAQVQREEEGGTRYNKEQLISLGLRALDHHSSWGLITPGELVTIAARPSMGKSSLLRQSAWCSLVEGKVVIFYSLEMAMATQSRIMAGLSVMLPGRVPDRKAWLAERPKAAHHMSNAAKWETFRQNVDRLHGWAGRTWFPRDDVFDVDALCADARGVAARVGRVDLISVDYCQLVRSTALGNGVKEVQVIADVTRKLKRLAKELGAVVMQGAQINRESEKDNRQPRLSDLRDSGSIEQDSDRVVFIWEKSDADNPNKGLNEQIIRNLTVAKNREGARDWTEFVNYKSSATAFISIPKKVEERGRPPNGVPIEQWRANRREQTQDQQFAQDMGLGEPTQEELT